MGKNLIVRPFLVVELDEDDSVTGANNNFPHSTKELSSLLHLRASNAACEERMDESVKDEEED